MTEAMPEERLISDHAGDSQRAIGWTLAGLGIAGVAAGTYFGVAWLDDRERADLRCTPTCDSTVPGLRNQQQTNGIAAVSFAGGGAAALIIGAVVVATAPESRTVRVTAANADDAGERSGSAARATRAALRVAPVAGPAGGGVVVLGTW